MVYFTGASIQHSQIFQYKTRLAHSIGCVPLSEWISNAIITTRKIREEETWDDDEISYEKIEAQTVFRLNISREGCNPTHYW